MRALYNSDKNAQRSFDMNARRHGLRAAPTQLGGERVCFTLPNGFSMEAKVWYDTSEKVESENIMIDEVRNFVRSHSSLNKEQFMKLAKWKSPRLTGHAKRNS
jgi:hypothetical protein